MKRRRRDIPQVYTDRENFINSLNELETVWERILGLTAVVEHPLKLTSDETQPVHCAPWRAKSRAREFEKKEMDKMLKMGEIELAKKEWTAPKELAVKNVGSIRFFKAYRRSNAVAVPDFYSFRE